MIIAERDDVVLRLAEQGDMPRIDEITIICYNGIHDSWVAIHGRDIYDTVMRKPNESWEEHKTGQNHTLYREHPEWLWVLEKSAVIIGFVSFKIVEEKSFGIIENNGVIPEYAGQGWGKFMYRQVLNYFREQGLKFAHVETGLDDPHIPARKAYEAVGFDRAAPIVLYWQDLRDNNPGSTPDM